MTISGANLIRLKLYISSLKTLGSSEPPPDIKIKPIATINKDIINIKYLFLLNKKSAASKAKSLDPAIRIISFLYVAKFLI